MRNVAICGEQVKSSFVSHDFVSSINIEGLPVNCGLINTKDLEFDKLSD